MTRSDRSADPGQGLVEFALVLPIFVTLLMGVIEFGFLYNNLLTVQFAARQGVSAAAQAGGVDGADCSILNAVERALTPPIDHHRVEFVEVFQSDAAGDVVPGVVNHYVREGTLDCPGTGTQPYTLVGAEGYPQIDRRDALIEGLDVIGVRIGYEYVGITPVAFGRSWDLADGATLRTEPKQ
ncbi:MAG TPA: TadE family protein [Candidatus Nanopelagicales bacterium]|nr:TadE family protein [Candidatus Nanopelagicales bacterium]